MPLANRKRRQDFERVGVIVAHPDDETLWAGGMILTHPKWQCRVLALCRGNDPGRSYGFFKALAYLGVTGRIADLDDGPEQLPLGDAEVQEMILTLLGTENEFDLLITHGPRGEYTRHRRHEETSKAVLALWKAGGIQTGELWRFAYEDGNKAYLPRAMDEAHVVLRLPYLIWQKKQRIITQIYAFSPDSWEARTTPEVEAFWCFESPEKAEEWLQRKDKCP